MEVVLRVNQLDACELDDTLTNVLQHQLLAALRPLQSTKFLNYLPELKTLLRLLVWKFSLSDHHNTLGQGMLDLKYASVRGSARLSLFQRGGLFIAVVLGEWMLERADTLTAYCPRPSQAQQGLVWLSTALRTLSLFNFIFFLIRGKYPTLKERVLGLGMLPDKPQAIREVSHRYLTREILWHGFSEFIFFVLPHFNYFSVRNLVRKVLGSKSSTSTTCCTFCEAIPILPHLSDCGHIYCYYCLKSNLIADSNFPCPACNDAVTACIPISEVM